MATGPIQKKTEPKIVGHQFTNLAQYNPSAYYLSIPGVKAACGIPNSATILSATVAGWSGLGTSVGVGIDGSDGLYVFFTNGWTISSSSYITVRIAYMV